MMHIGHVSRLGVASVRRAAIGGTAALVAAAISVPLFGQQVRSPASSPLQNCPEKDNAGLSLPPGFCATVFADGIGHARHMVVAPNGVVYVNTWSGRYYGNRPPHPGGFLVALQDTKGDGRANVNVRFGAGRETGNAGGNGIALYKGALYAETNDKIVRYTLPSAGVAPTGAPETIVSRLPLTGDHPMHPFAIDPQGNLYVDLGSATDSCQARNRVAGSPGIQPCRELKTRGGIWRYDANKTGQRFSPAERFATGLRNGEGISFDSAGRIIATQHGRDQLHQNWPRLFTVAQGANEPAEELVQIDKGADFGWPYCYYDLDQKKLVLAPEYGGDGRQVGLCADKRPPIAVFPAHWAPNDMLIYNAQQFPIAYRGGAFIAFHGSWNRAPLPQGGYNVVFQPLTDGHASGPYVVFADGFAGRAKEPGAAAHRPTGLAVAPDGALYISDDQRGRIWRVTYQGAPSARLTPAPAPTTSAGNATAAPGVPPEGIHPEAGTQEAALPLPPGATRDDVTLGARIYRGEVGSAPCAGCHGANAEGTPLGPGLTTNKWLWGNGSVASIKQIISQGVPEPKEFRSPMPPMGGAQLSDREVSALADYVWALSHPRRGGG